MTEGQAVETVRRKRTELQIDEDMEVESVEKAIVECKKRPERPGRTEDRVAWNVTLVSASGYVVVHVDDRSGDILSVKRSA